MENEIIEKKCSKCEVNKPIEKLHQRIFVY